MGKEVGIRINLLIPVFQVLCVCPLARVYLLFLLFLFSSWILCPPEGLEESWLQNYANLEKGHINPDPIILVGPVHEKRDGVSIGTAKFSELIFIAEH
jgi:hypothetical protein